LKIDGHDNAIIGPAFIWHNQTHTSVLVYNAETIRDNLVREDGMSLEDAREFIEFNSEGAYVGPHTPVLVWPEDMWDGEWDD
jgi:hypothetical protein